MIMPVATTPSAAVSQPQLRIEAAWAIFLLLLALVPRLAFVSRYPTVPVSDFRGVVDFALAFRDQGVTAPGYYWDVFNVGPPLALSLLLRIVPDSPDATARLATAVWTGLMALLPFAIWRGVLPPWARILTGGLLAIWPGQVFFSGVVAQDNWVLPPTVALAALAARPLLSRGPGHPVAAGLVYALAVAMRQEMMYVLLPLLLAAAGLGSRRGRSWRSFAACALAVGLPFLALVLQRGKATGEYALSSGHLGITLLGTAAPGATASYWADPVSYAASIDPGLARDRKRLHAEALGLALEEIRRRPGFHALRTLAMALRFPFVSDAELLYWSVFSPGTLPESHQAAGQDFAVRVSPWLKLEMVVLQGLFVAAVTFALWRRRAAILVISLAALLKIGLHATVVVGARFFLPATALEIVAVSLAIWEASQMPRLRAPVFLLLLGLVTAAGLGQAGRSLFAFVQENDPVEQRVYRFTLTGWNHRGSLACTVRQGRLTLLGENSATIAPLPATGPEAAAECVVSGAGAPAPLVLQVTGPHEVEIDGREVSSPAANGAIPLGQVGPDTRRRVRIEVSADTSIQLAPAPR